MQFLADEFSVARCQIALQIRQVFLLSLRRKLFTFDLPFQHIQQMHRVGGDFGVVEVEHLGQDLEGEPGGNAVHPLVYPGVVAVFLHRLGLGISVLEVLAVINPHLGEDTGVFRLLDPGQHREPPEHFQCTRRTGRFGQRTVGQQFLVNLDLIRHPQAVRHLDDVNPVEERLVVLVALE